MDHVKSFHAGCIAPDSESDFDVDVGTSQSAPDAESSPAHTDDVEPPLVVLQSEPVHTTDPSNAETVTPNEDNIDNSNTPSETIPKM